jgi:hypothetical protein
MSREDWQDQGRFKFAPRLRRKKAVGIFTGFALAFIMFAPVLCADEFSQVSHYTVRLFSFGTLTIDVRTGDLQIDGWDDPHVGIEVEKIVEAKSKAKAQSLFEKVKIQLEGRDKQVSLRAIYPSRRLWRPFRGESKLPVNFRIRMPYDSNLVLKCVDGDIWVRGMTGQVKILDNYGDVEMDVPSINSLRSLRARTWLGTVQSDLHGEDSSGFSQKVSFWNASGTQDVNILVHLGGIYIYSGE